jgi:hypothetical protein
MNMIPMRLEDLPLVSQALFLIRIEVFDLRRFPRPLRRRPRIEKLHHALVRSPALWIYTPTAMLLQRLVHPVAQVAFLLRGDRLADLLAQNSPVLPGRDREDSPGARDIIVWQPGNK